jgi:hypothetical protein
MWRFWEDWREYTAEWIFAGVMTVLVGVPLGYAIWQALLPREGVIKAREFVPAHMESRQICVSYDTKGGCSMWIPQFYSVDDAWYLKLANGAYFEVPKATYENVKEGMWFDGKRQ